MPNGLLRGVSCFTAGALVVVVVVVVVVVAVVWTAAFVPASRPDVDGCVLGWDSGFSPPKALCVDVWATPFCCAVEVC